MDIDPERLRSADIATWWRSTDFTQWWEDGDYMDRHEIRKSLKMFALVFSVCFSAIIAAVSLIAGITLLSPVIVLGFVFPRTIGIHLASRIEHGKENLGRAFAKRLMSKVMS